MQYKGAVLRLDYEFVPGWFITTKGIFETSSQTKGSNAAGKNFRQNIGVLAGFEYKPVASQNMKLFGYYYNNQVKYRRLVADANEQQRSSLFAVGVLYLVNAF
ncbi:hypothetical protein [Chitinophaga sp. CB10]|uniref:hypothetical protein n=1 Tax=Chitinophaga sp. CB10 TaxID=1891659 RepID=UPI0025C06979|nr:hypothetical protein [Chitinophaga sp. CB10]